MGNAWHVFDAAEPRGRSGMRDPVGTVVPGMDITIISGSQFQGVGNAGNQLDVGSAVIYQRVGDPTWATIGEVFIRTEGNNKFFAATISAQVTGALSVGDELAYYLRIAYDDHDVTYVHAGRPSAVTDDESTAQAAAFRVPLGDPAEHGLWEPVFELPNAGIHAHLLPDGQVLMWGRRDRPDGALDEQECTPFVWDPASRTAQPPTLPGALQPTTADGNGANLFCSGHGFLPDGQLLVAGGHFRDGDGLNQTALYNQSPPPGTWTPSATMNNGRWYPTVTILPDGRGLVLGGQYKINHEGGSLPNQTPQVWDNGTWTELTAAPEDLVLDNYPRAHVASNGWVLISGPLQQSWWFDPTGPGQWTPTTFQRSAQLDYAPAVMYDVDKIAYIGGGGRPVPTVEIIDLAEPSPAWTTNGVTPMHFPRRQHNAALLPDGTVLVTGGTRGDGFNNLDAGNPVHLAELWNPEDNTCTILAAEEIDRCYHATTVLLPDATVLSAGGGEFAITGGGPNDPLDTHRNAQIFHPPYLFRGPRPRITDAPVHVQYGQLFELDTPDAEQVTKVSWIRLPSATHAFDQSQRVNILKFQARGPSALAVTTPANPNLCPPGHYMLFILNKAGVPSPARIVAIQNANSEQPPVPLHALVSASLRTPAAPVADYVDQLATERSLTNSTTVTVGITSICPYGLGACWGGAHEALTKLDGVVRVHQVANSRDSTATVFLDGHRLPQIDLWTEQFDQIVNGRYVLRGVEVTLAGQIKVRDSTVFLIGKWPDIELAPTTPADKVQWDFSEQARQSLDDAEALAFHQLRNAWSHKQDPISVTGPLHQSVHGYRLLVRSWNAP